MSSGTPSGCVFICSKVYSHFLITLLSIRAQKLVFVVPEIDVTDKPWRFDVNLEVSDKLTLSQRTSHCSVTQVGEGRQERGEATKRCATHTRSPYLRAVAQLARCARRSTVFERLLSRPCEPRVKAGSRSTLPHIRIIASTAAVASAYKRNGFIADITTVR
ncbi:hypothetical protein J6590_065842 [Homalodisca vitripennis]|nr:hypothetical protein J6590_065842 [Homalodisca vitripennis]